ncbi:MAG: globin [Gammaproteobacteria bacterium]|nr:globin [Gammaproteobacteria bacterium]MCW8988736.1 globin [Gammaproteobacteria bacterium]MCW9030821.1 globin [Gammaproteobacteria bacterium]
MTNSQNVKNCWTKIRKEKGPDLFVDHFYQSLFIKFPAARDLFPSNIETQKRTLLATLDNMINGIDYIEAIRSEILDLGRHHKNLGVTAEMFNVFILTIVESADFASNSTLTDAERTAWEEGFREMANIMLEAF